MFVHPQELVRSYALMAVKNGFCTVGELGVNFLKSIATPREYKATLEKSSPWSNEMGELMYETLVAYLQDNDGSVYSVENGEAIRQWLSIKDIHWTIWAGMVFERLQWWPSVNFAEMSFLVTLLCQNCLRWYHHYPNQNLRVRVVLSPRQSHGTYTIGVLMGSQRPISLRTIVGTQCRLSSTQRVASIENETSGHQSLYFAWFKRSTSSENPFVRMRFKCLAMRWVIGLSLVTLDSIISSIGDGVLWCSTSNRVNLQTIDTGEQQSYWCGVGLLYTIWFVFVLFWFEWPRSGFCIAVDCGTVRLGLDNPVTCHCLTRAHQGSSGSHQRVVGTL